MTILVLGLVLWLAAHLLKRLAPEARGAMERRMGPASKGVIAAVLLVALVLIVLGYRSAEFWPVWSPPLWTRHINNLAMLFAVALFGLGHSKSRLRRRFRHPMLWSVVVWAAAHLLVNGDVASILLFGTMLLWALAERSLINRAEDAPAPYAGGSLAGDIRLAIITLVIYGVIAYAHVLLGVWPFPG
ncbi:NnrU family protein [Tranquillimonas rosea]|uniref:NnrU family protein n=1 Tax=Tranquillimonas rosea TaxID=641238 RepID=UPI003BAA0BEC